jgi:hypothetical protein
MKDDAIAQLSDQVMALTDILSNLKNPRTVSAASNVILVVSAIYFSSLSDNIIIE